MYIFYKTDIFVETPKFIARVNNPMNFYEFASLRFFSFAQPVHYLMHRIWQVSRVNSENENEDDNREKPAQNYFYDFY